MLEDFHKQKTLPDLHAGQERYPLPQKIGPYPIESKLSKGGMSVLFLGKHPETGEPIVIKVLLPKYLKNKEMASRFLKEAQVIGMSNHPNIVRLYGQGSWEKGLYIAMEFVQGVSLRQFIQKKSLSHKRALEIVIQVAYALAHLHAHGVIHRDLKPENILITETGEIKVIDFGIAQVHSLEEERITQKKRMMGTPTYMSPEQKENPSEVSFSSDIYSLGILTYELYLGRLSHGVIHLALLPKALRAILEKALRADPKERYQDIVDFITDLSHYLRNVSENQGIEEVEPTDELMSILQQAKSLLLPAEAPHWPQIEIGLAIHEGLSSHGLYLDLFHLPQNRYCIFLAEPLETKIAPFLSATAFRGMVRMALHHSTEPMQALQKLNEMMGSERFSAACLSLDTEKNQLHFISCHSSPLYHLPGGSQKWRTLTAPNPPLGAEINASFIETTDNWEAGDQLLLLSQIEETREDFKELELLSTQAKADKMFQKLAMKRSPHKGSLVLVLQRQF